MSTSGISVEKGEWEYESEIACFTDIQLDEALIEIQYDVHPVGQVEAEMKKLRAAARERRLELGLPIQHRE